MVPQTAWGISVWLFLDTDVNRGWAVWQIALLGYLVVIEGANIRPKEPDISPHRVPTRTNLDRNLTGVKSLREACFQ